MGKHLKQNTKNKQKKKTKTKQNKKRTFSRNELIFSLIIIFSLNRRDRFINALPFCF